MACLGRNPSNPITALHFLPTYSTNQWSGESETVARDRHAGHVDVEVEVAVYVGPRYCRGQKLRRTPPAPRFSLRGRGELE